MLNGKDKNIKEQMELLEEIIKKNSELLKVLTILEKYAKENPDFRDYYLAAGCINQTVFNYYHDFPINYGIKDYDIVYYEEDMSYEKEDKVIRELSKKLESLQLEFDIKNEKRVPLWYNKKYNANRKPYTSVENAISRWGTTITCIGLRMEDTTLKIVCPYGLNDLFSLIIRPVKIDFTKENYEKKCKEWKEKWPKLEIKSWEE